jgi:hypothetical protein
MDLHADRPSRGLHLSQFGLGPWKRRIDHHGDGTSVRQQIAYQFKPLRCHLGRQQAYTGQIRSRPAEALDETARDRVRAAGKDDGDGDGGGGLFRGVRRDGTTGHYHGDLTADQISRQRRQPVIVTLAQ